MRVSYTVSMCVTPPTLHWSSSRDDDLYFGRYAKSNRNPEWHDVRQNKNEIG